MKHLLFFILLGSIISSCSEKETKKEMPIGKISVQNPQYYVPYCIYFLGDEQIDRNEIELVISQKLPEYAIVEKLSDTTGLNEVQIEMIEDVETEYPPPSLEYLKHSAHNLTSREKFSLQMSKKAAVLIFSGTNENVLSDHIRINSIIDELIEGKEVLVTDYITVETFNSVSWKNDRVKNFTENNPDITTQFTSHNYREGEFCRSVTLGLGKFCIPDISIKAGSCNKSDAFDHLINVTAQLIYEHPEINGDSTLLLDIDNIHASSLKSRIVSMLKQDANKKANIKLRFVEPEDGDAPNTQFKIVFNDPKFNTPQKQQEDLLKQLFGFDGGQ